MVSVSEFLQRNSNIMFVARMWEETLVMILLWNVKAGDPHVKPSGLSPSWSWVSVVGNIESQLESPFKSGEAPNSGPEKYEFEISDISYQAITVKGGCVVDARLEL
ncbi:hypothetical protein F4820DRAFT_444281 [Hypoxylon rubiginosum]|uniref:Uncharacterized protein n=1 Tax=Hypoxylon rubiginosum TaxID=110542 RepID=A0ACB9ZDV1_9PEZI|nr:hypothetical protein F4820DRAFT_444281 [Hypoxylon rubiginosum]